MTKHTLYKILGILVTLGVLMACLFMPSSPVPQNGPRRHKPYEMCTANMAYLATAMAEYEKEHGRFPPAFTLDNDGNPLHSWRTLLLPYLGEKSLYEKLKLDEPWDSEHNRQFHFVDIPIFRCSTVTEVKPAGLCYYDVVVGESTAFPPSGQAIRTVDFFVMAPSLSDVILLVERKTPVPWMEPGSISSENLARELGWRHEGGEGTVIATAALKASLVDRTEGADRIIRRCNWKTPPK